jgi:hypothetical protein
MSKVEKLIERLHRMSDIKLFAIGVSIVFAISVLVSYFMHFPFWPTFFVILFSMFINGLIADWEDNQPGGFNNPD